MRGKGKTSVILGSRVCWESLPQENEDENDWGWELGSYLEGFIVHFLLEQVKCEFLQPLCLDLLQPNGLEHLGGFQAILREGTGRCERVCFPLL